jgi:hypothetical protein
VKLVEKEQPEENGGGDETPDGETPGDETPVGEPVH